MWRNKFLVPASCFILGMDRRLAHTFLPNPLWARILSRGRHHLALIFHQEMERHLNRVTSFMGTPHLRGTRYHSCKEKERKN